MIEKYDTEMVVIPFTEMNFDTWNRSSESLHTLLH